VTAYHARTKHGLRGYAREPETPDSDAQRNSFREFAGAPRTELAFTADGLETGFSTFRESGAVPPLPLNAASVAALLELSVGLSAWKELGPDQQF
jgi:hypothetical protein